MLYASTGTKRIRAGFTWERISFRLTRTKRTLPFKYHHRHTWLSKVPRVMIRVYFHRSSGVRTKRKIAATVASFTATFRETVSLNFSRPKYSQLISSSPESRYSVCSAAMSRLSRTNHPRYRPYAASETENVINCRPKTLLKT